MDITTMERENRHHDNGFMNGLLLGIIIGAAAVFLLGTKQGRRVLRMLSEEGIEGLGELRDIFESEEFHEDMEDMKDSAVEKTHNIVSSAGKTAKRFFRGARKR
ncbi:MAG TPA: YtxH domain-containing protein [Patescibacteria group bacterium]|nr:YtxH domain-containing protein [Patescibacteria group bacterium]